MYSCIPRVGDVDGPFGTNAHPHEAIITRSYYNTKAHSVYRSSLQSSLMFAIVELYSNLIFWRNYAMEIKRFSEWITLKEKIHTKERIPRIKEGEVWWLAIGENVGIEINGKSEYFSRPVLVFKKLSYLGFMGIPLSTQKHEGSWYVNFRFQDKNICAALAQARTLSTARLYTRLGQIAEDDMEIIKKGFQKLYL